MIQLFSQVKVSDGHPYRAGTIGTVASSAAGDGRWVVSVPAISADIYPDPRTRMPIQSALCLHESEFEVMQ